MAPVIEHQPHTFLYPSSSTLGKRRSKSGSNLERSDDPWSSLTYRVAVDSTEKSTALVASEDAGLARTSSTATVLSASQQTRASTTPFKPNGESAKTTPAARRLSRRRSPSPSPSESSSSSGAEDPSIPPTSTTGIGRKVAASLQLFKDLASAPSTDDAEQYRTDAANYDTALLQDQTSEAQPHFEFVKRSEWPQREAARRESSSTGLPRVRPRASSSTLASLRDVETSRPREGKVSIRDALDEKSLDWHIRGRPQEKLHDIPGMNGARSSPETALSTSSTSTSRIGGKHSPSVSQPTSNVHERHSRSSSPTIAESILATPTVLQSSYVVVPSPVKTKSNGAELRSRARPVISTTNDHYRSSTPPYDRPTSSLWSTDEESGWDTASGTATSASATSASPFPLSPATTLAYPPPFPADASDDDGYYPSAHPSAQLQTNGHDHDSDNEFSEAELPHIPLRPFRNQVGGHNAIYKFTKRAVCKPLVSRENLFYESVEREAPPLLGYIPRYLGVMLVSYRRVRKDSHNPMEPSFTPRPPPLHKSTTAPSRPLLLHSSSIKDPLVEVNENEDTEPEDTEMPEVALDRNRHIVPPWMLRGDRSRSFTHSYASHRHLQHLRLSGATASSPDLGQRQSPTRSCLFVADSPPNQHTPQRSPERTPAASPNDRSTLTFARGRAISQQLNGKINTDEEMATRPSMRAYHTERLDQPRLPKFFGGTGSTVVNTKLKDHVFSTVLRRFRRRTGGRTTGARTEDEGDIADVEDHDDEHSPPLRGKPKPTSHIRPPKASGQSVRRVRSEATLHSPTKPEAIPQDQRRGSSHELLGLFDFEDERSGIRGQHGENVVPDLGLASSFTRRSQTKPFDGAVGMPQEIPPSQSLVPIEPAHVDPDVTRQDNFILMEDLTGRMKHSSVLDLKMGTRQYGMDATAIKKKSQRKKCDKTTSRSLGVRVCGMQVWNNATQSYVTQDKYQGREIRAEDFHTTLASFFSDGDRLLAYQIPALLQKLFGLARIINRLVGYRFYGCSVLLIYDGDQEAQAAYRASVLENPHSRSRRGESLERAQSQSSVRSERPPLRRVHSEDLLSGPVAKRSSGRRKRGEVNVRIVDFAHTTTGHDWLPLPDSTDVPKDGALDDVTSSAGYNAKVDPETGLLYARFPPHYPDEPDRGFLFGIKNLACALERIWNEERLRRIKAVRDDPQLEVNQLPLLPMDGCEILEEIFSEDNTGHIST